MYIESWSKLWCPRCSSINWLPHGDCSDPTGMDVEGFQCWKCRRAFHLDDEMELQLDSSFLIEEGMKRPQSNV